MVYSAAKSNNNHNDGWGMGLLFIFFNNNNNNNNNHPPLPPLPHDYNNTITRKRNSFSISPSSSSNLLLSKTQSTLSICALLLFTTLFLFTLISTSQLQPPTSSSSSSSNTIIHNNNNNNNNNNNKSIINSPRRFLHHKPIYNINININSRQPAALQGIGQLYLRGTKSMSDLIVAHLSEETSPNQIRTFIRLLLHTGLLSRVDLVFVFPSMSMQAQLTPLLNSECGSLVTLVRLAGQLGRADEFGPGLTRYLRPVGEGGKDTLWGKRRGNSTSADELTRPSYGSVVGFEASELDPEDTLSGFLDHVPMRLRRWACYPMLLGRVRRNYKHVTLVDANNALIVSDPFTRVRNRSSESVFIWSNPLTRHGKRNPNPGVLIGGARGLRRFTNAALTEIVRVSIEHKGKNRNSVTESGVVNQLVHSGHLLKSINLITSAESIPDSGSLLRLNSAAESGLSFMGLSEYLSVVQRVNSGGGDFNVDQVVMREICLSHKLITSVYSDCLDTSRSKSSSN